MSTDSIGYPLPVLKNGYACLNAIEIELASKNIDPARPRAGPESSRPPIAAVQGSLDRSSAPPYAREAGSVTGYAADAVRRFPASAGTRLSLSA
jgi:hypothetical protein